ncbi:hypothetical protein niasHS_017658 [Heterodera schachtii]|uniref:Uncharacterized protein n=1 Tax=Heterodera schachtii TaxID=97005 RepID=A0ABD2HY61_HETSC
MEEEERTNLETERNCRTNPPKGVTEKDYADFLKLLDGLNVSEEESLEEEMENEGGETQKAKANDGKKYGKKKVQFAKGTVIHSAMGKKSILRNRNERSPINNEELQKMCKRDIVEFLPTPKEILGDFVFERSAGNNREKRKPRKGRPMSAWKSRKMDLSSSDEERI